MRYSSLSIKEIIYIYISGYAIIVDFCKFQQSYNCLENYYYYSS